METNKVIVVLLIIAIVFSVVSIVLNIVTNSSFLPVGRIQPQGVNYIYERTNAGPDNGNINLEVVRR